MPVNPNLWSPLQLVNAPSGYAQEDATVTALADGGFAVVWQTRIGPDVEWWHGRLEIAMRLFNADGSPRTDEFLVSASPDLADRTPSLTELADGSFAVVWGNYATDPYSLTIQRMAADGTRLGDQIRLDSVHDNPEIAALPGGGFVAVWNDLVWIDNQTTRHQTVAQIFAADGSPEGGPLMLGPEGIGSTIYRPDVTALAGGGFVTVWDTVDATRDSSGSGIFARIVDATGTPVGQAFLVNAAQQSNQWDARVSALPGGGFVVVWRHWSDVENERTEVRARRFDATGTALGDDFRVNQDNFGEENDADVTGLRDGGFAVVWSNEFETYMRLFGADGAARGDEFKVFDNYDPAFPPGAGAARLAPTIAELADGRLVVTAHQMSLSGPNDVFAAIVDPRGAVIGGTVGDDRVLGNALDNRMSGGLGADDLSGLDGADSLSGGAGADSLRGGDGDDLLQGGTGDDLLDGGLGQDTARFAGGAAVIDLRQTGPQQTGEGMDRLSGIEHLTGGSADDSLTGSAKANRFAGGRGADQLRGLNGADSLDGGRGNDRIWGGGGADSLTGDAGSDRFIFETRSDSRFGQPDTITDFLRGTDKVDLSALDLHWRGLTRFTGTAAELRLRVDTDAVRLLLDTDGDGSADAAIVLAGLTGFGISDLIL